ncbi:glycosyl hydrolase [uncultured Croceicoccus sp.]|uniref:glycosyl hydrolase n=1 Tax=uncultured Croceicoccus sp. TaxID=1295329 RepID=UPI00261642F8|nr:glycosyl hydrolase [uncultured Croceicoccus sp.]
MPRTPNRFAKNEALDFRRRRITGIKRAGTVALLSTIGLWLAGCTQSVSQSQSLAEGFANPPSKARPYSWWHWMNGNVSAKDAEADLRWMADAGIGGVQLFEGTLSTPRVVDPPLIWSSPEWGEAVARSAFVAEQLGLELAIASSPGWSATGAPFVQAPDAMKKLVWSRIEVPGAMPVGMLPSPPDVAGPIQDLSNAHTGAGHVFYRDVRVLAFPSIDDARADIAAIRSGDAALDTALMTDERYSEALSVPMDTEAGAALTFDFGVSRTISSFELGLNAATGFGAPPPPEAVLSVSEDGTNYRTIADLPGNTAGVRAITFAPETVRFARVELLQPPGGAPPPAPGTVGVPAPPAPDSFSLTEARFSGRARVDRWVEKAGFATTADYYANDTPATADDDAIPAGDVVDVTGFLQADGSLAWVPPAGRWTILRLGYSLTGETNGPAPAEATGLEVDKLDPDAVARYITHYLDIYREAVGDQLVGAHGIRALLSDSIEAGAQNWTPRMIEDFRRLRGYDPTPFLPTLTGVVIDSAQDSDRFLWDFRRTISDLLTEAHYGTLAREAQASGLIYYAEALEDRRPQLGDDLAIRARADIPMGAFWWAPNGRLERPTLAADIQGAASVANIYGRELVGAESLTAFGKPFGFAPADLKPSADHAFALGVNRMIIHTSAHQPLGDAKPGFSLAPQLGQYFTRHETWAGMARGWTDYLARVSWLMQQGRHAADIAYFVGEEAPVTALYSECPFDGVPRGYGFDFVGEEGLRSAMRMSSDGTLISNGGVPYRLLALGGSSARMTLSTLERIHSLVSGGAVVAGPRPDGTPSLSDDVQRWEQLADELWPAGSKSPHRVGKGIVFSSLDDALHDQGMTPDWTASPDADFVVQHRRLKDAEIYFVFNRGAQGFAGDVSLRAGGFRAELWDAVTGRRARLPYRTVQDRTLVSLEMPAGGSAIVVLLNDGKSAAPSRATMVRKAQLDLSSDWQVRFDGPDEQAAMQRLVSWTELPEPELKYHSGTATYRREFSIERRALAQNTRVELDLGKVGDVAEVMVNGVSAGIAWTEPYTLDVTPLIKPGVNTMEIRVANLWVNRLIGDAVQDTRNATVFGPTYTADADLRTSGLLGPVRMNFMARADP